MRITLIHPPLDDPTLPYHAIAYLAGQLRAHGFDQVSSRDINIEYVDYLLSAEGVQMFCAESERRRDILASKERLSYREQEEYYELLLATDNSADKIVRAAHDLRDRSTFLDYDKYLKARKYLAHYLSMIGSLSYPAHIQDTTHTSKSRFSIYNFDDLLDSDLGRRVCKPFDLYLDNVLFRDADIKNTEFFGISIIYDHQLMHALHLARRLRGAFPDAAIVLGGTSITQCYKYLTDKTLMKRFFDLCDAIVVGEGETAICELAEWGGKIPRGVRFTNTITYDKPNDQLLFPDAIFYENVGKLAAPHYEYKWDLYLSPARGINYSPTRGCYWNRCTFCDYGLNTDKPTSPWRERNIDDVIVDLKKAQSDFGVDYVYFAVDVMAPGYLERLSDAIITSGLKIKWSAELRMEKIFSLARCEKMAEAGCVCISFGMESGNQRILDLIDKGTKVSFMSETMKNFAHAGIAVQLMCFSEFPSETPAEKLDTINFIRQNEEYWATGGMGTFLLTGTSIIARRPEDFGLTLVPTQDAHSTRAVAFRTDAETGHRTAIVEEADASFDGAGGIFPAGLGRPWAGGTDTLHSMIYYEKYGREFFKRTESEDYDEEANLGNSDVLKWSIRPVGVMFATPFDIGKIIEGRQKFDKYLEATLQIPAEPTFSRFTSWADTMPSQSRGELTYWLSTGQNAVKIDKIVYRILQGALSTGAPLKDLLAGLPAGTATRLLDFLIKLEGHGFVAFIGKSYGSWRMLHSSRRPNLREVATRLPTQPSEMPKGQEASRLVTIE